MRLLARAITLATLAAATSCSKHDKNAIRVFAAASLAAPFEELADAFESTHPGTKIELHCAGTQRLVLQLMQGAPADVFASADTVQMQKVVDAGLTSSAPTNFAANSLAIVTSANSPHEIASLQDLTAPGITVLICGPNVPAGRYARTALENAGIALESRSDEPSVQAVVSKVRLGLVDAGIVYTTDAQRLRTQSGTGISAKLISRDQNIQADYPIATMTSGQQSAIGNAFVAFVLGSVGQEIMARHGFTAP